MSNELSYYLNDLYNLYGDHSRRKKIVMHLNLSANAKYDGINSMHNRPFPVILQSKSIMIHFCFHTKQSVVASLLLEKWTTKMAHHYWPC
jgi:hypothetical protein